MSGRPSAESAKHRMTAVRSPNLIDAFSYYLVLTFVTGTILRARNYRAM